MHHNNYVLQCSRSLDYLNAVGTTSMTYMYVLCHRSSWILANFDASKRVPREEQNDANFNSLASSSEKLRARKEI